MVGFDPRSLLEEAARNRRPCHLRSRNGTWQPATFVRVDRAGVVVVSDGAFQGGEDVRAWFVLDDVPWTFEASVLRSGVPVPDRTRRGLLLGFIDGFARGAPEGAQVTPADGGRWRLEVRPARGRGLELTGGPVRLVDLGVRELTFAVPRDVVLKFVVGGRVRLRFTSPESSVHECEARVREVTAGDSHYLYALEVDAVGDERRHLEAIEALRSQRESVA